jgi:hypothetical protein
MKSKRDLVIDQLTLMDEIRLKADINIVTCGHCGCVFLHKRDDLDLTCFDCKTSGEPCDHPDLFYTGMEDSGLFDEEVDELTKEITSADVIEIAYKLKLNPTLSQIQEVLRLFDSEVKQDPSATWDLIVENILYNIIE